MSDKLRATLISAPLIVFGSLLLFGIDSNSSAEVPHFNCMEVLDNDLERIEQKLGELLIIEIAILEHHQKIQSTIGQPNHNQIVTIETDSILNDYLKTARERLKNDNKDSQKGKEITQSNQTTSN